MTIRYFLFLTDTPRSVFSRFVVLLALLASVSLRATSGPSELPAYAPDANAPRSAVPAVYHWDLSPLFTSDQAFEQARLKLLPEIANLKKFEGKLTHPAALSACLDLYFRLHRDANFLTMYANLRQKTAQSDDALAAMGRRSLSAMEEIMQASSFIRRELLVLPAPILASAYASQPALAPYRAYIDNMRRRANRVLSPDAERALGLLGDNLWAEIDLNELPSGYENVHSGLLTDIPWPKFKDEEGRDVQLTLANYPHYRASPKIEVRRAAVTALFGSLRTYQHALAGTLAGQIRLDVAYARARGYDTALAAYLDKDDVSPAVYANLVQTINANLPLLHRYVELRKKALGLSEIHLYDLYIPLVAGVARDVPFAEARESISAALQPLGDEYGRVLAEALDPRNGWIDLYPHKDKESGASSSSVYGPHPWIQMNYQNSLNDMSTLAHELGHSLHSHLAMQAQSYPDFRYTTLLAEIASTCNESLLLDYLLDRSQNPAEKAYLLVERLESIRTTIFRQTMFAEFEMIMHQLQESGTPITAALLDEKYRELVRRYYGPGFSIGPDDGMEWAYISHFFYKYYVYAYATGLSSGIAIADRVRTEGEPAVQAYLGMLRGGCAKPPLELLKAAGVDLATPAPIEAAMRTFARTLDEVEKLLVK
ncbi:MAG: oligoendopeptidase F family protein [Opitutaceae bacterium]|nr:oligoendopeptidase F family protein [Opitutaceae bacterium]